MVEVKEAKTISSLDGLLIPGGESTTIGKLLVEWNLVESIREMVDSGKPILGTCAGMVLLANRGGVQVEKTNQPLLGLMDVKVNRNYFGSQRESFETNLNIPSITKNPVPAVFIRAPIIEEVGKHVEVLAKYQDLIVFVRQGNLLGLSFHPELTEDTSIQQYFIEMIEDGKVD